jgi:uncharacterized protein (TIGR00251 family)
MTDTPSTLVRTTRDNDTSELDVQVVPRASQSRIVGPHAGRLKVQLAAPPVDGAANAALIDLLADTLELPRAQIELLRGHTGKRKTLRIALAAAELRRRLGLLALLLAAPACESQYAFPIHVVLPDDQDDLARADNLTLALDPQNLQVNYEVDGVDFSVGIELEPDNETSTLAIYLAEGTELLAWGRSAPFVLAAPQDDLAVYLSPPGALSTFPGKIGSPDPEVLASPALGRGILLFNSDGHTGLFNAYTLGTEVGATLKPEGKLPSPDDGALVPDSRGNVWRVAWAESLRAFLYVPGDDLWSAAEFTGADAGARADAAHIVDAGLERLLVFGGGEQRSILEIDLQPDDAGAYTVTTLSQQLDSPRRAATAIYVLRGEDDSGEGVVLVGGDDPAVPLANFLGDDGSSVSFGEPAAWTGLQCAQVERDADADTVVSVLCLGGLRDGAATTDAIVLNFPPGAAEPSVMPLAAFLPEPAAEPRLFEDDAAIYAQTGAQSGSQWLRIDRETLTIESRTGPSPRVRGGHSISLSTGATFLVGGWTGDDRPVDHWHVFVPTLAATKS